MAMNLQDDPAPSANRVNAPNEAAIAPDAAHGGRLNRQLSSIGVLLLTLSCLSPVLSVYGAGSDLLQHAGTGAAGLLVLAVLGTIVWATVYAELGSAYPYAGGEYVGVGSILGGWAGVATSAMWAVTAGPANAFEAQILSKYVAEIAPGVSPMLVALGSLCAAVGVALLTIRNGALVTGLFLLVEMTAVLVLICGGFIHPARSLLDVMVHPVLANSSGELVPVTLPVLAIAGVSALYATVGGGQALYFGEELRDPHERMGGVVLAAGLLGAAAIALPIMGVVLGAHDLKGILDSPVPIASFVSSTLGPRLGLLLSAGVAAAIFNAMIVQIMTNARLFYSAARDKLFNEPVNRWLGQVDASSGAPRAATLLVGMFSAVCCFFSAHTLLIFLTGLLVYPWALVCLAVWVGRAKGITGCRGYWRAPLHPLFPLLGLGVAVAIGAADFADPVAGRPSLILLGLVFIATILWNRWVLQKRAGGWAPSVTGHDS
jgi:amino acid transporter